MADHCNDPQPNNERKTLGDCSTIHRTAPMENTTGKRGDKAPYETRRRNVLVGKVFYSCQKKLKYVRY